MTDVLAALVPVLLLLAVLCVASSAARSVVNEMAMWRATFGAAHHPRDDALR